jgi:hypothetical protein
MSRWKELTGLTNTPVFVNLDAVAFIEPFSNNTRLTFAGDAGHTLGVREAPEEIFSAPSPDCLPAVGKREQIATRAT